MASPALAQLLAQWQRQGGNDRGSARIARRGEGPEVVGGARNQQIPPKSPALAAALRRLAAVADTASADGFLAPLALDEACAAADALSADVLAEATAYAIWSEPRTRRGLIRLMSFSVRRLAKCPTGSWAAGARPRSDWQQWRRILQVTYDCFVCLGTDLPVVPDWDTRTATAVAEVLRLVVSTDLVPSLVRVMVSARAVAAVTLEMEVAASEAPPISASARGGAGRSDHDDHERDLHSVWWLFALMCYTFGPLRLFMQLAMCADEGTHPVLHGAWRALRDALQRSQVMEHGAHAALTSIALVRRVGARGASWKAAAEATEHDLMCVVKGMRLVAEDLYFASISDSPRMSEWADRILEKPCMQHFLMVHVLSQLRAAYGGTSYGLPEEALLQADVDAGAAGEDGAGGGRSFERGGGSSLSSSSGVGGVSGGQHVLHLSSPLMFMVLSWWTRRRSRAPSSETALRAPPAAPFSDRALRAVCERIATAIHASWAPTTTPDPTPPNQARSSGAAAAAEAAASGVVGFFDGEARRSLALEALDCAVGLARHGSGGSVDGLWDLVVRCVNAVVQVQPRSDSTHAMHKCPLETLRLLPLPPLGLPLIVAPLPAHPAPALSAALAAGYVPCLERLIRHETRLASCAQDAPMAALDACVQLVGDSGSLAGLMAYGEPRSVAALVATVAKVIELFSSTKTLAMWHDEALHRVVKLSLSVDVLTAHVPQWDVSEASQEDRRWWDRAGGGGGGGRSGGPDGGAESGSSDSGGGGGDGGGASGVARLSPLQQLLLLSSFAYTCGLQALSRFAQACVALSLQPSHQLNLPGWVAFVTVLGNVPLLTNAYLDSLEAAESAARRGEQGAAAGASTSAGAGGAGAPGAAAASWRKLLLEVLQLPLVIERLGRYGWLDAKRWKDWQLLVRMVEAVLYLSVAFPAETRIALSSSLKDGLTLVCWLCSSVTNHQRAIHVSDVQQASFEHFLQLAPAVAAGKTPTAKDVCRIRERENLRAAEGSDGGGGSGKGTRAGRYKGRRPTRLAALLPPPCFVAAELQLPLCSNPSCHNLDGDSELEVRLLACTGCRGAVSYCSRGCQSAHWKAGHKTACGWRAGP